MTTEMDEQGRVGRESERRSDVAAALHFLVLAQREFQQHSIASVAAENSISRSNLSAYLASRGERRSVADNKLRRMLLSMGANWQLGLRPRLHRWDVSLAKEALDGLEAVARANPAVRSRLVGTVPWTRGDVFGLFETGGDALVFARVPHHLAAEVAGWFGVRTQPCADVAVSDYVSAAWEIDDADECNDAVVKLLSGSDSSRARRAAAAVSNVPAIVGAG